MREGNKAHLLDLFALLFFFKTLATEQRDVRLLQLKASSVPVTELLSRLNGETTSSEYPQRDFRLLLLNVNQHERLAAESLRGTAMRHEQFILYTGLYTQSC